MRINPAKLKPHPANLRIYGKEDVSDLVQQIKKSKWCKDLVITSDYSILSGHRRWLAITQLGWNEVGVDVSDIDSENDQVTRMLLENKYRDKTNHQRANEYKEWKRLEAAAAAKRHGPRKVLAARAASTGKASDIAAAKVGWSGDTAERAVKVQEVISANPDIAGPLNNLFETSVNPTYEVAKIIEDNPAQGKKVLAEVLNGNSVKKAKEIVGGKPHITQNSGDNEWFTPKEFIAAARKTMGSIDLDPASHPDANKVVKASTFYTKEDDGLTKTWSGNLWLNPPYEKRLVKEFTTKLCKEYKEGNVAQACVLVNNATETTWFQSLAKAASAITFPKGRIQFWHPSNKHEGSGPLQGQAIVYLGKNTETFTSTFSSFGLTVVHHG